MRRRDASAIVLGLAGLAVGAAGSVAAAPLARVPQVPAFAALCAVVSFAVSVGVLLQADRLHAVRTLRSASGCTLDCAAGLHYGRVLIGGIGREKREVGYWGDALNTAARVQGLCRALGTPVLLTADFARELPSGGDSLPEGGLRRLGLVEVRGKHEQVELYAFDAPGTAG